MKKFAIIENGECSVLAICPICGKKHFYSDDLEFVFEEPIVGKYPGWDDAFEICCDRCSRRAEILFSREVMHDLEINGELEEYEMLAQIAAEVYI